MSDENNQSNEDWLEEDWMTDEKTKTLSIPGLALPGLRDLRILFIALIEFNLFLGPIVHLNEISRGSNYIQKLKDFQTVSEVYAGLARADIDELTTLEDSIAIFRYHHKGETDTVSVLIISCIPGTDLSQVKELGSNALFNAKGDPKLLGQKLSSYLREKLITTKKFRSEKVKDKILILDENRISKPLDLEVIDGLAIIDYQSKTADFRLFPSWFDGKEIIEMEFINFIDKLATAIKPNVITSMIFQDIVILATQVTESNTYVSIIFSGKNILELKKLKTWFLPYSKSLAKLWKFASPVEIRYSLEFMNSSIHRDSIEADFLSYITMCLRGSRLKPTVNPHFDSETVDISLVSEENWNLILDMDGTRSITEICKSTEQSIVNLIPLLEWARIRDIILYFEE